MALGTAAQAGAGPVTPPADATRAFTVRVTGTGDRPMILIPGLLSSGEVWEDVVEHYSSRYRLHVLTLAGFAGVPAVDGPLLPRVRDELIAYIRQNQLDRPVLVGHSLGAFLALWVASTAPDLPGPIVAVDGVPFLPALMNPSATAAAAEPMAQQMRTLYRSMTAEQLEMQTRMALGHMITGEAGAARATAWARRSDGPSAGQALYELMTTDLRESAAKISSELLLIAAVKSVASMPDRLDATLRAYEAQVARVPRHQVVAATQALHFVMLDDPQFLVSAMDEFLARRTAAPPAGK
jgi:pimeloyl-ACP methyl ester carboxylesterase